MIPPSGLLFKDCLLDVRYEETVVIHDTHTLNYDVKADNCGCGKFWLKEDVI